MHVQTSNKTTDAKSDANANDCRANNGTNV
jgi:hypothetical protein